MALAAGSSSLCQPVGLSQLRDISPSVATNGGEPLPDEIALSRAEAASVLFALDAAMEGLPQASPICKRLERAAAIIVEKFFPDLPDL